MNEKRSILSADVNLLEGPILKNLIIFALPILISYIFQQLYNTMDVAIVGNTLGTDSLAAMGSVTAVFDLLNLHLESATDWRSWRHGRCGCCRGNGDCAGRVRGHVCDLYTEENGDSGAGKKTFLRR